MSIKTPCPNSVYHYHVDEGIEPDGNCTFCQIREAEGKMKPEDQVPDLELCKRLKELGMPQKTFLSWWAYATNLPNDKNPNVWLTKGQMTYPTRLLCAAPTVAELGEILPVTIRDNFITRIGWMGGKWFWAYNKALFFSHKEANVRANVLIWCVENGYVEWK